MDAFGVFKQVFKDFTKLDGFETHALEKCTKCERNRKKHDNGEKRISLQSLITTIEIYEQM